MDGLLLPLLVLEAGLLGAMAAALVAATGLRSRRRRRLAGHLARTRTQLVAAVADGSLMGPAAAIARALPPRERLAVFTSLAASLHGEQRRRLAAIAAEAGLLARADGLCRSWCWWRRLRGVRLHSLLGGGERTVPARLDDRSPEVRAAAAAWVAGHPTPELMAHLLELLDSEHRLVRFMAKDALLRLGHRAVPAVAADLLSGRRRRVAELMEVARGLAESRLLGPALKWERHPDPRVRALVAALAAAVGGEPAVGVVERMLADRDPQVRSAAAHGLGRLGHWPSAPRLAGALRDPAWDVRREAGLALRALGAPGQLLLRRALGDPDRFARDMSRQVLDLPGASPSRMSA